ncbi:response regulator transcription factor [Solibacillus silvestris]|uniref:response regulator transcription factor n=1 Tax=Solibacillus silvestris TaxID=76853 RepID=UPI003F819079
MNKILVVDDEEILRMLICDTLEDFDFAIDEAEDGVEALAKMNDNDYDLVILDYMMPYLTGLEVIEQLSQQYKEKTPIVMLTAKAQESDRQIALDKGAKYFISKPFSPIELIAFVEELMNA